MTTIQCEDTFTAVFSVLRNLRTRAPRLLPVLLILVLVALLLSGCEADVPQNTFDAKGEVAKDQRNLFYLAMWPAIVVLIGVFAAIIIMCLRFRERDPNSRPPKQIHGNTRLEIAWTIAPIVPLLILGGIMVPMIYDLGDIPSEDEAYYINVEGQRFNFFFSYPEILDGNGQPISVLGTEAHIPAGEKVAFRLTSTDVIHSFWLPKLGGKLDVVPGAENILWLKADEPGTFYGQCAELCGTGHAEMRLIVTADSPADFEAWADEQRAPAEPATRPSETPGTSPSPAGTPGASASPSASPVRSATPTPTAAATPTPTGS